MGNFFKWVGSTVGGFFSMIGTTAVGIDPMIVLGVFIVLALIYVIYLIFSELEDKFGKVVTAFAAVAGCIFAFAAVPTQEINYSEIPNLLDTLTSRGFYCLGYCYCWVVYTVQLRCISEGN